MLGPKTESVSALSGGVVNPVIHFLFCEVQCNSSLQATRQKTARSQLTKSWDRYRLQHVCSVYVMKLATVYIIITQANEPQASRSS